MCITNFFKNHIYIDNIYIYVENEQSDPLVDAPSLQAFVLRNTK